MGFNAVKDFIYKYPEILPLVLNLTTFTIYVAKENFNKATYWLGASILTLGLLRMK
jgi:hypothetical protein